LNSGDNSRGKPSNTFHRVSLLQSGWIRSWQFSPYFCSRVSVGFSLQTEDRCHRGW